MSVSATYSRSRRLARQARVPASIASRERNAVDDGRNRLAYRMLGLIADVPPSELPVEAVGPQRRTYWNDATNARARDGARERVGGWQEAHTVGQPPGSGPYFLHYMPPEVAGEDVFLAFTEGGILAAAGQAWSVINNYWTDLKPAECWAFNHGTYTIYHPSLYTDWSQAPPNPSELLPDWPGTGFVPDWEAAAMCRAGNFFVAAMRSEYGTLTPDRVRWSDAAAADALPQYWQPAPDNLAGEAILPGAGPWTGIAALGDAVAVYRYGETWIGQYVGAPYVWDFRRLFRTRGAVGPKAIAEVERRHFVVSDEEFGVHDGVTWRSLSSGKVARWLRGQHNEYEPANGVLRYVPEFRELWYMVPGEREGGYAETFLIYSLDSGEFTVRPIDHQAEAFDVGTIVVADYPETWEEDEDPWQTDESPWNTAFPSVKHRPVVSASNRDNPSEKLPPATSLRAHEYGTDANGTPQLWRLERRGLDFDDPHAVDTLVEVWPRLVDIQECWIDVRVGAQMDEREPVAWSAPVRFELGMSKVDVDVSGRLLAVELSSTCAELARVEGFDVVFSRGGRS